MTGDQLDALLSVAAGMLMFAFGRGWIGARRGEEAKQKFVRSYGRFLQIVGIIVAVVALVRYFAA